MLLSVSFLNGSLGAMLEAKKDIAGKYPVLTVYPLLIRTELEIHRVQHNSTTAHRQH